MVSVVDASNIKPCPFCSSGAFEISENGRIWLGTRYGDPVSYTLIHWCGNADPEVFLEDDRFSEPIKMKGKTREDAIAKWNTRA